MPVPIRNRESLRVSMSPESSLATPSERDSSYALRHEPCATFLPQLGHSMNCCDCARVLRLYCFGSLASLISDGIEPLGRSKTRVRVTPGTYVWTWAGANQN